MPTNRELARALRAKGKTYKAIGAALGVSHQWAQQLCTTELSGRPLGRPRRSPPKPPRLCRCGCGTVNLQKGKQYLPGHRPGER